MSKTKKINSILILILSILLITVISFSFAAFTTRITNNETNTTIATGSGIMEITYSSGESISVPNIFPDNNPFITKEFTVTGNNSNPAENMHYHLLLVLDENTFRSSALTFTLESNNINDNGYIVPEIITQTGIKTGEREIFLGNGMFTPTNNEDKVHSYTLKLFFPKIEHFEHGVDQGKIFKAHIETREGEIYPGYNAEKGVNHPVLFTGMTPVKWEGTTELETTEDDPDWYDYNQKRWANAKSADGSYWVWIPRYAYKIETCYHTSGEDCYNLTGKYAGDIDVKFLKSTTNLTEDNTTVESTGYEAHVKDTSMHHFLHPAFQFNGEELGFWVAKYLPTQKEASVMIKPNENVWNRISVSESYLISKNIKNNSVYGWFPDECDSYMMTNLEWGAITYLSQSEFGANDKVWINNSSTPITGCSGNSPSESMYGGCQNEYDTIIGQKASSTHNIYGVYDMSGAVWQYVMTNIELSPANSGFSLNDLVNIKKGHINFYFNDMSFIYGNAIYETTDNSNNMASWYKEGSFTPTGNHPWYARGGDQQDGVIAGIFSIGYGDGRAASDASFRPVLTPL